MHTTQAVAPESTAVHYNGNGNGNAQLRGTSGIVLRNDLPMSILPQTQVSPHLRHLTIQAEAYFLAQRRGFQPGHELDDWLAAEESIGQVLAGPRSSC